MTTVELTSERVATLIAQCRRIADIFDETIPGAALAAPAHRRGGINPYHHIVSSGIYLEFYYGYPSKLCTPGGKWHFVGSTVTPAFVDKEQRVAPFMTRLATRLHTPWSQSRWGSYGPVYAVLAIDGEPVEPPGDIQEVARPSESVDFAAAKQLWSGLADGWDER